MLSDFRQAIRLLTRNPSFAFVACLTLALGIGANTAVFSVVDAALFRPLPYKDADRLVDVHVAAQTRSGASVLIQATGPYAARLRAIPQVFEGVEVFRASRPLALASGADQSPWVGAFTPALPGFLGVAPQAGRSFTQEDVLAQEAVVISDGYWTRAFNRDRDVVGRTLALSNKTYVVVGVMPPTFRYVVDARTDAWLPLAERDGDRVAARVRPGLTVERAQQELNAALAQPVTARRLLGVEISRADWYRVDGSTRMMLFCLLGAVGCVLLIACANVANLLLSGTLTRQREIAVRSSLGATRGHLARQFLIEGLVLASLGGVAAAVLAWGSIRAIPAIAPSSILYPLFGVSLPQLDLRVLAFGGLAALLTGVLCGALPALRASHAASADGLLTGGQRIAGASRSQRRVRDAFQALQVAMTLLLLAGAGLLVGSFLRMATTPVGFDDKNLGYASLDLPPSAYAGAERRRAFLDDLLGRVALIPGVRTATAGSSPAAGYTGQWFIPERSEGGGPGAVPLEIFHVRPDYFRVTGMTLKEGRTFGVEDGPNAPQVAIISENAARRFWPGQSAIGQRFRSGGFHEDSAQEPLLAVVGVVPHIRTISVARDGVEAYLPERQTGSGRDLLFRMTGEAAPVMAAIRAEIRAIDPSVTVTRIGMVDSLFAEFDPMGSSRFYALTLGLFAAIGLLTAAVGLYGVLAYSVSRRTHEIGVRTALGADGSRVRRLMLADVLRPVAAGIVLGLVAALWLSQFLASQLFQTQPRDPMTFAAIVVLFVITSAVAAFVPVRRATRVDPVEALRAE